MDADISMPVMDGLEMAEELRKKNQGMKVVLLTSYRDFDYVKKGMSLGVSSYLLKNKLSAEILKSEIEKIMSELLNSKEKNRMYTEHNLRLYLNQQTELKEDLIYKNRPLRRFSVLFLYKKEQIRMEYTEEKAVNVNLLECENLRFPSGIVCRDIVGMGQNCWCAILFIEPEVSSSEPALLESAQIILDEFSRQQQEFLCIAAEPVQNFLEIPKLYQKCRTLRKYTFSQQDGNNIFLKKEIESRIMPAQDMVKYRDRFAENCLCNQGKEEGIQLLQNWLETARQTMNSYEYGQELKLIYMELQKLAEAKKLDPFFAELPKVYASVREAELCFISCFSKIQGAIETRQNESCSNSMKDVLEYISIHYAEDISIQDIADAVGLSEGHLRKRFKRETGETIVTYLTEYRISRAKVFMQRGETRMREICAKTGFASEQYFSYVFKKSEGMSPSVYMKSLSSCKKIERKLLQTVIITVTIGFLLVALLDSYSLFDRWGSTIVGNGELEAEYEEIQTYTNTQEPLENGNVLLLNRNLGDNWMLVSEISYERLVQKLLWVYVFFFLVFIALIVILTMVLTHFIRNITGPIQQLHLYYYVHNHDCSGCA